MFEELKDLICITTTGPSTEGRTWGDIGKSPPQCDCGNITGHWFLQNLFAAADGGAFYWALPLGACMRVCSRVCWCVCVWVSAHARESHLQIEPAMYPAFSFLWPDRQWCPPWSCWRVSVQKGEHLGLPQPEWWGTFQMQNISHLVQLAAGSWNANRFTWEF